VNGTLIANAEWALVAVNLPLPSVTNRTAAVRRAAPALEAGGD